MNNIYTIITTSTLHSEYRVKANSEEEAEEKFYSGEHYDTQELDEENVDITEINLEEENEDDTSNI